MEKFSGDILQDDKGKFIPVHGTSGKEYKSYISTYKDGYYHLQDIEYNNVIYGMYSNNAWNVFGDGYDDDRTEFIAVER
jgi:hypothetical protein